MGGAGVHCVTWESGLNWTDDIFVNFYFGRSKIGADYQKRR